MIYTTEKLCDVCQHDPPVLCCTVDKANLCADCMNDHIEQSESDDHKFITYEVLSEMEIQKSIQAKQLKQKLKNLLIEKIDSEKEEIKATTSMLKISLNERKSQLINMIEDYCRQISDELTEKEKMSLEALEENKTVFIEDENILLNKISSINQMSSIKFSEYSIPIPNPNLLATIKKEFNLNLKFYPTGKPYVLHYFKPGKDKMVSFDIFAFKETVSQLSFTCKDYPSVCYGPQGKILYSGG